MIYGGLEGYLDLGRSFFGIDFGTTNSSVAVYDGQRVRVLEMDSLNDNTTSLPSLLYLARDGEAIVGRGAADAFIERNVDREVILKKVALETRIEGYIGGEGDNEGGMVVHKDPVEHTAAVTAWATVEVNSPGRLFQSLKTSLRLPGFTGTEVFGRHYQIEELTAKILGRIKSVIDEEAGEDVRRAVFGRPVRFSMDAEEDELAERRLRTAAHLAGFEEIVFFYEPVAACVEYAVSMNKRQRLMVVDIGGGTCDVCVMEFGGAQGAVARLAESRILGVSGVPVAGDAIDKEIVREKLYPRFGSQSRNGPAQLPLPRYIFNSIADWQNLYKLNTEEIINWLIATEVSSTEPSAIRVLRCLIQGNYGYPVMREIEQAKKRLSFEEDTSIELHMGDIQLSEQLERREFSHIIEVELEQMLQAIGQAEAEAGLEPKDIDYVLTTGGTSLVPAVRTMLEERFGAARLIQRDTFTSVAAGLAVVAQQV